MNEKYFVKKRGQISFVRLRGFTDDKREKGEFSHRSRKVETRDFIVARMTNAILETTDCLSYLTIFLAFVSYNQRVH